MCSRIEISGKGGGPLEKCIAEVTAEATGEHILWARSAWAASRRYPLHWGGDSSAQWDNLAPQIAGGLSFGLSGFQF